VGTCEPRRGWPIASRGRNAAADHGRCARLPITLSAVLIWTLTLAGAPDLAAQVADEEYLEPLLNQALETEKTGVELPWRNPDTGSSGIIVIERTFYRDPGTPCRDYRRTLERAGAPALEIEGTGCRVGPGEWALDEEEPGSLAATPAPGAGPAPPPGQPSPPARARTEAPPPSCPTMSVAPVPCSRPPAVVDYTMPTRTKL
jgi:17 kDa outer membrane surface antigen